MTRFALTLEFDGTPFAGLQRQANAPTVQAAVDRRIERLLDATAARIVAGGARTEEARRAPEEGRSFDPTA